MRGGRLQTIPRCVGPSQELLTDHRRSRGAGPGWKISLWGQQKHLYHASQTHLSKLCCCSSCTLFPFQLQSELGAGNRKCYQSKLKADSRHQLS